MRKELLFADLARSLPFEMRQDAEPQTVIKRVVTTREPELDAGSHSIKTYVSTREMDRDFEVMLPGGCDFSEFKKTRSICQAHDYSKDAIGKATWWGADDYGVKMAIEFAPTDEGEQKWALAQFMPVSFSVGFQRKDVITKTHGDWTKTIENMATEWPEFKKNRDRVIAIIRKWMLWEVSMCPVPSNFASVTEEVAKEIETDGKRKEAALIVKALLNADPENDDGADQPLPVPNCILCASKKYMQWMVVGESSAWVCSQCETDPENDDKADLKPARILRPAKRLLRARIVPQPVNIAHLVQEAIETHRGRP